MAFWTAIFLSSTCEHSPLEPPGPDSHADLPLPPNPFAAGPGDTTVTLVGAGDIVRCDSQEDEATANLLDTIPGIVFTAGDNAYADASQYPDFATCYEASWGRHKARTRPAHGHMENWQPGSANYYNYFGAAAGDPAKGYYSYDVGAWHVVVLNSKSTTGLIAGSAQNLWLINDPLLTVNDERTGIPLSNISYVSNCSPVTSPTNRSFSSTLSLFSPLSLFSILPKLC
jgi:hypothetical protein